MDFNNYQRMAISTAVYPKDKKDAITYTAFGLVSEAGEVCGKLKKVIRDGQGLDSMTDEEIEATVKELGDTLWYCATLAEELGFSLSYIAAQNITKLYARQKAGTIGGSGDDR